jgi:NAD(P) transhydrogenase subunit alpha
VAATPSTVKQLAALGYEVVVEKGAGSAATFADEAYGEAGAGIVGAGEARADDVVLKVNAPT